MIILLVLLNIPILWSLIYPGFFHSHDGSFHLVRLMHFYNELNRGQFPVRYSFDLAFGHGYPVFTFFYPLTNYIGSLIHYLGFDFGTSLKIVFGLWTLLSSFFCFLWLKKHFSKISALIGATLYLYAPYRLLALYVTGSIGIITAMGIAPLLMLSIHQIVFQKKGIILLALSSSLLIIAHNVSALIFFFFAVFYGLCLWLPSKHKLVIFKKTLISAFFSLGLVAFFVFPLISSIKYTRLKTNIAASYQDHFPTLKQLIYSPWGYGTSIPGDQDGESFQLGISQWLAILISTITLFVLIKKRQIHKHQTTIGIFIFTLLTIFLMLKQSTFIWQQLPILQQIQFPWRILMLTTLLTAYLGAWLIDTHKNLAQILLIGLLSTVAILNNRNYLRPMEAKVRYQDVYYQDQGHLFYGSTDIAWEILPKWVSNKPYFTPKSAVKTFAGTYQELDPTGLTKVKLDITNPQPNPITFNIFFYPNWQATIEQETIQTKPDKQGLLTVPLPQGNYILSLKYQKSTIEIISDYISLFSWVILIILVLRKLFILQTKKHLAS